MTVYVYYMIYCIKKYKSVRRAIERFHYKFPGKRVPNLKDVFQIFYDQIYFETKTAKESERRRDKLIAICFDESSGTYGEIIQKLTVWFRLHKFFIINSLLRSQRLENVDMNTVHQAEFVKFPKSETNANDDNSESSDGSEDSFSDEEQSLAQLKSGSSNCTQNYRTYLKDTLPVNALDPCRVPIVYTLRLEEMAPLPELSVKKFLKQTELNSKPHYKREVISKTHTTTRREIEKQENVTEKPYVKDVVIVDDDDNDELDTAQNTNIEPSIPTIDLCLDKNDEQVTTKQSCCYSIPTLKNMTKNQILDRDIIIVFHDIRKNNLETYSIDGKGKIIDNSTATINHKSESLKEVLLKKCGIIHARTFVVNVCCWFYKKSLVKALWPTIDDTLKFMKPIHYCTFGNCKCCCRKRRVNIKVATTKDTSKCLFSSNDRECDDNRPSLIVSPLVVKAMYYTGNKFKEKPTLRHTSSINVKPSYLNKLIIENTAEGLEKHSTTEVYEVNSQGDVIDESIILESRISDEMNSSGSQSTMYVKACCLHARRNYIKQCGKHNLPMQSINYLDNLNESSIRYPNICEKCKIVNKTGPKVSLNVSKWHAIEHSKKCHKLFKYLRKTINNADEDKNVYFVAKRSEIYNSNNVDLPIVESNVNNIEDDTFYNIEDDTSTSQSFPNPESNVDNVEDITLNTQSFPNPESNVDNVEDSTLNTQSFPILESNVNNFENATTISHSFPIPESNVDNVEDSTLTSQSFPIPESHINNFENGTSTSQSLPNTNAYTEMTNIQNLLRDLLMKPARLQTESPSVILASAPNAIQSEEYIVRHLSLKLHEIPVLMENINRALIKLTTTNHIKCFLERFKDIKLTMHKDGRVSATLVTPLNSISQNEIPLLQTTLEQIRMYLKSLNVLSTNFDRAALTNPTWSTSNGHSINCSSDFDFNSELFSKYEHFEKWMCKQNELFSNQFYNYYQQFEVPGNDELSLPKICNVFSLSDLPQTNESQEKQTEVPGPVNMLIDPINLEEQISYTSIVKSTDFDFERDRNMFRNLNEVHHNETGTTDSNKPNSRKRKLDSASDNNIPVITID